jgi:hypothetical protein
MRSYWEPEDMMGTHWEHIGNKINKSKPSSSPEREKA